MSLLAQQQQALVQAIMLPGAQAALEKLSPWLAQPNPRGLQAYRANGRALVQRALAAGFPVTAQLLGDENFKQLATQFWQCLPPACGDIAQWGGRLPEFIQGLVQLASEPFLSDVAAVEWAMHQASSAANGQPDLESLALMVRREPSTLLLSLPPGTRVIESDWPVVSIINAHLIKTPSLAEAGEYVAARKSENALVWRQGLRVQMRDITPEEAPFMEALLQQAPLATAMAAAPTLDFAHWLASAVREGLLLGVRTLPGERSVCVAL